MQWTTLLSGLSFAEGPRWHEGRLWFSDFYTHRVIAVTPSGEAETIVEVPQQPSGLGWIPDGRLLVVSMIDRKLLRLEPDGLTEHADLNSVASFHCNDMVVDRDGRAYVGNFGFDHGTDAPAKATRLARVEPDGSVHPEGDALEFPNGTVITDDGRTLIVGETRGQRLTAFDVGADGSLSAQRVWADLGAHYPDGICLDAEGAIWVADPRNNVVIRVEEGGRITDRLETPGEGAFACMLGGNERRTLYVCVNRAASEDRATTRLGRIIYTEVSVPGAGWPGN